MALIAFSYRSLKFKLNELLLQNVTPKYLKLLTISKCEPSKVNWLLLLPLPNMTTLVF